MREIIFQNDNYVKTVIRGNPFHIMDIDDEKLNLITYDELEKMSEDEAKKDDWKIIGKDYKKPDDELLDMLQDYKRKPAMITLEYKNKKIEKGSLVIPSIISKKLDDKTRRCNIYHDEEEGDVFIHFNTKKPAVKPEDEEINNRRVKL